MTLKSYILEPVPIANASPHKNHCVRLDALHLQERLEHYFILLILMVRNEMFVPCLLNYLSISKRYP